MPKTLQSPVTRWPGSITLPDYLNFPQEATWEAAIEAIGAGATVIETAAKPAGAMVILPAILDIVQGWELGGGFPEKPTLENFPATPKQSSAFLIAWIIGEISSLYEEGQDIPLA